MYYKILDTQYIGLHPNRIHLDMSYMLRVMYRFHNDDHKVCRYDWQGRYRTELINTCCMCFRYKCTINYRIVSNWIELTF